MGFNGVDGADDRPPPARSARVRPSATAFHRSTQGRRQARAVDPRFDPMFGAPADTARFERDYKFLLDQQDDEEAQRRFRVRCLKCVLRRHEIEQQRMQKRKEELASTSARSGGRRRPAYAPTPEEEEEDEDLADYEKEVFGQEHLRELAELKLTPPSKVYQELEKLQRESQLYVSRHKNTLSLSRKSQVRKELIKKEVKAVRDGSKAKPFFPRRSEMKKAVLADKFDELEEKGGKGAVDRYLSRKVKRGDR